MRQAPIGSKAFRPMCLFTRVFAEDDNTQTTYNYVMTTTRSAGIDSNAIMSNILVIRGHRVLLDSNLAALYQVGTKALTRAVRRNAERFPGGFMFQLAAEEV
jgi:ORF6N domain